MFIIIKNIFVDLYFLVEWQSEDKQAEDSERMFDVLPSKALQAEDSDVLDVAVDTVGKANFKGKLYPVKIVGKGRTIVVFFLLCTRSCSYRSVKTFKHVYTLLVLCSCKDSDLSPLLSSPPSFSLSLSLSLSLFSSLFLRRYLPPFFLSLGVCPPTGDRLAMKSLQDSMELGINSNVDTTGIFFVQQ